MTAEGLKTMSPGLTFTLWGRFWKDLGPSHQPPPPCLGLAALWQLEPSLFNQWPHVYGLSPPPSDEPTSLGMSAEGSLRSAIVPPYRPSVSEDEGHSLPGTFANKERQLLSSNGVWLQVAFSEVYFLSGNTVSSIFCEMGGVGDAHLPQLRVLN